MVLPAVRMWAVSVWAKKMKRGKKSLPNEGESEHPTQIEIPYLSEKLEQPLFCINEDGIFEYVNPCAAAYFHSTPEQMTGKNISGFLTLDVANRHLEKVRQTIAKNKRLYFTDSAEIMGRKCWFDFYIWPMPAQKGQPRQAMVMAIDLTGAKHAELELAGTRECIERMIEISDEPMVLHIDGLIQRANKPFTDLFGYRLDELAGTERLELTAPQEKQRVGKIVAEGFTGAYRTIGVKKDGSVFPVEI